MAKAPVIIQRQQPVTPERARDFPVELVMASSQLNWENLTCFTYRNAPLAHWQSFQNGPDVIVTTLLSGVIHGQYKAEGRQSSYLLTDDSVAIIPAGCKAECFWNTPYDSIQLFVRHRVLDELAEKVGRKLTNAEIRPNLSTKDGLIHTLSLAVYHELRTGGLFGKLYVDALTQTLALHLLRVYAVFPLTESRPPQALPKPSIRRVQEYIHEHLARDLTLTELAEQSGFSQFHLTRLFRKAIGCSLHQYVIEQRVQAARRLMETGQASLKAIAAQVGFADQSHLTRHFKRLTGGTPAEYIKERKDVLPLRKDVQDGEDENK